MLHNIGTWIFLTLITLLQVTEAKRNLKASSMVTCMENSQISSTYFDVIFDPDSKSLHYTLNLNSQLSGYVIAHADVYAYGFKIISETIDVCSLGWKQLCPIYPGQMEIDSIQYISDEYVSKIPGIAYTVPDIDAFVRVLVHDSNQTQVACIQAFFTNGKTVSQPGVKWATAIIAGIGLLTSAIASTFGNSNAASHVSANAVSLFLYFQSVAVIAMQHVDAVPPIASAWCENLIWSMGLIRVSFMQKIFRWYVDATGGDPSLYLTSSSINVLVQRSLEFSDDLYKRGYELVKRAAPVILYGNANTLIFRGIKRIAYQAGIETTSVVATGFTFFILCSYVLIAILVLIKSAIELGIRFGWINQLRFIDFRQNWKTILKGTLARYIYIGFTQLVILSLWEFVQRDSPAVITLAAMFLLLALGVIGWSLFRTFAFARASIAEHRNPAYVLYGDEKVLNKYGFIYTMFDAKTYWWGAILVAHAFVKAVFIALAQYSGKTQAIVIWVVDMVYLGLLFHYKPYLNTPTNVIAIAIQFVITINSFFFTFFSNIYGQPAAVGSIMGWVFFILNAAFSLILLVAILVFCGLVLFSKNPDTRFKPASDDRTSFQRHSHHAAQKGPTAELLALGLTAQDHQANWENEIKNINESTNKIADTPNTSDSDNKSESLTGKITRKLSLNRNKSSKSFKRRSQISGEVGMIKEASDRNLLDHINNNEDADHLPSPNKITFDNKRLHTKQDSMNSFDFTGSNNHTTTANILGGDYTRPSSGEDSYSNSRL
ncbi:hypothetical protein WICPIJ_002979 [Wickerhamomyces pijperi]|uniref:ML-like domain-containing protein n=1 Tax=Wickerhamomyces pijperi TaxID=599730 RepID=A0A9P8TPB6_WICPI|nr:hypothetical protein WICPIJ_002979 [Wickerhamomyces pijperi]